MKIGALFAVLQSTNNRDCVNKRWHSCQRNQINLWMLEIAPLASKRTAKRDIHVCGKIDIWLPNENKLRSVSVSLMLFWSINIITRHCRCTWKKLWKNKIIQKNQWKTCNSYVKRKNNLSTDWLFERWEQEKEQQPVRMWTFVHKCGANKPRVVARSKLLQKNTKKRE